MKNIAEEFRHTLSHLDTLCTFAKKYDKDLKGISALIEAQTAVLHTMKALDRLEAAFNTFADIYSDIESYSLVITTNPKNLTGLILADYERALMASCILDSMKNEHAFFSQRGLEELLICLQSGLVAETSEF